MLKPVIRFPLAVMRNIFTYLTQTDIEPFINISHKCAKSIESITMNPWSKSSNDRSEAIIKKIFKFFPRLEVLQVDPETAKTISDDILSKVKHLRLSIDNHDQLVINDNILNLTDTVYRISDKKPDTPLTNKVRAYINDDSGLTHITNYIEDYPNLKTVVLYSEDFRIDRDAVKKIQAAGHIIIHIKFTVRTFDRYDAFIV
ncbi:hypothetical protein EIN_263450 [Entamoeba invadens IP1]|uniref:F-box domain-containing protein n=1 Tax=Entamoeba invadens IP1 TaxID=370355 RepID=L7FN68_ENTIV|nr:hypothetical protein EIN_263450 [Entamoeba invadens IP1]ELP92961.1 hypothetical protein EIN_263450 [Entamoeba invadens IP1]|eukprot:XP_004259732.1 hypothetical protein EIN_263450 [Entamoeba invadens IP1]